MSWTSEAEVSLRDIFEYIARNRPETARRTIDSIIHRVESLAEYPRIGQPYRHLRDRPVFVLTYGSFRIAYLVRDAGDVVVLGVFHGLIFLPLK
ncbi:MAG: type II toxin-antitoxin system RelE/ParE family toxin [bacterium]|nr:type II toxin-antitoxin system RelE/ParE family toxin [bacterium]